MSRFIFMLFSLFGFIWSNAQISVQIGSGVYWSKSEIETISLEPNHKVDQIKRWRPFKLNVDLALGYRFNANNTVSLNIARQSFETSINFCQPGANCPNYYQNNVLGVWMFGLGFSRTIPLKRWQLELGADMLFYQLNWSDADWNLTTRIWNQVPTKRVYSYRDEFLYREELNAFVKAHASVWYQVDEKWPFHLGIQAYTGRSLFENYSQIARFRPGENASESSITLSNNGLLSGLNLALRYSLLK